MAEEQREAAYLERRRRTFGNEVECGPSKSNAEQDSSRTRNILNEGQVAGSSQSSPQPVTQSAWAQVFRPLIRPLTPPLEPPPAEKSGQQGPKTATQADSTQQAVPDANTRVPFGSALSDVQLVVTFARSIYRRCRDAEGQYDEICHEVRRLHVVLKHLKYEFEAPESPLNKNGAIWAHQFAPIIGDCDLTLRLLDNLMVKYGRVDPKSMWPIENIEIRQLNVFKVKLISHTTSLTLFLDTIQLRQSELATSMDDNNGKLDFILDKVDIIATRMSASNGAYSRLSYNEDDNDDAGREVWKHLRRELIAEGFASDVLEQHKVHP